MHSCAFVRTLPFITGLAQTLLEDFPDGLPYVAPGRSGVIWLDRRRVSVLLANMFLCTFGEDDTGTFPRCNNFLRLFQKAEPQEVCRRASRTRGPCDEWCNQPGLPWCQRLYFGCCCGNGDRSPSCSAS